jgi:hypothetical protein
VCYHCLLDIRAGEAEAKKLADMADDSLADAQLVLSLRRVKVLFDKRGVRYVYSDKRGWYRAHG